MILCVDITLGRFRVAYITAAVTAGSVEPTYDSIVSLTKIKSVRFSQWTLSFRFLHKKNRNDLVMWLVTSSLQNVTIITYEIGLAVATVSRPFLGFFFARFSLVIHLSTHLLISFWIDNSLVLTSSRKCAMPELYCFHAEGMRWLWRWAVSQSSPF